jgi:hypothetical protein
MRLEMQIDEEINTDLFFPKKFGTTVKDSTAFRSFLWKWWWRFFNCLEGFINTTLLFIFKSFNSEKIGFVKSLHVVHEKGGEGKIEC